MQVNIDQTHWYDRIWAAFIYFTRLPLWRWHQPPRECYSTVVEHWPLTGWLTGSATAVVLLFGSYVLPWNICVLAAMVVRLLLTGAMHEDGLADFFDGFGGGGSQRQRILDIMKDSRTGTFGVLAVVLYELLLFSALSYMSPQTAAVAVMAADPFARMVASQLVIMLPYARTEEEAKSKTVYRRMGIKEGISLAVQGLLPMIGFIYITGFEWQTIVFIPAVVMYFLYLLIWNRLHGYTGDCCGAVYLLVELTVYLVIAAQVAMEEGTLPAFAY